MSNQREAWLTEYLQCLNATEAARRAGYKWPNKYGPALKLQMADRIKEELEKRVMSRHEALARLERIASFDPTEYIEGAGSQAWLNLEKLKKDGHGHLIRGIKQNAKGGSTIEWSNPDDALKLILNETKPTGTADDPTHHKIVIQYADSDPDAT